MNLLIVDDTPTDLKLLRAQIEAEGHVVFEAHDGVDALALLNRQRVDAVISDILMPRMDGYRLCYEIRKHARLHDLPFIIYSVSFTSLDDEKLALDIGANKYLKKPVSLETLVAALHEVIAQPHAAPRPKALQEVEVLKEYSEQLVHKLEEKNTELIAAEVKFRTLVEHSIVGIYIIQDDQFVYVNPRMAEILGWSEEEMTSRTISDFIVPEDQALVRENIRQRISNGVPSVHYDLRVLHQSGAVLQVEVHGSRTDYNGRPAVMGMLVDITERKKAEAAAQRSQKRLRDLIDGLGPSMFVGLMTLQGILIEANRPALAAAGLKPEDVLGKPLEETYWWAYSQEVQQQLRQAIARAVRGEASRYDVQVRVADNHLIDVDFSLEPLRDETGEVVFLVPSANVITERKRAEESIARERHLLRTLVDVLPETFYVKDLDSRFLVVNETVAKQYGKDTPAQLLGLSDVDLYPAGLAAEFRAEEMKIFAGEPLISHEDSMVFPDGRMHTVLTTKLPFRDSQGRICGLVGIGQDITGRKRAAESLRQSEERYRLLFEHNPLPMWLSDAETLRFLAVNESAVQDYGYTREEFLGMTIKDIRPPEDIPALLKAIAEVGAESRGPIASRHRRKDGTIIQVEIISRPLVFEGRQARLVLAADITEKKLLEEKFLHAQRLESIGLLSAGIAHDLNNALAPIVLTAPLLRASLSAPRDLKILDMLEKSAERGAGLVKQILGFAHSTTGEFRPTQVKHLARDLISVIEQTFPKSIQLEQQISTDLWPVQGNATQIHQVLLNLCVNARDAMPSGGTLRLAAANLRLDAAGAGAIPGALPGTWVVLEVADTGAGIPPEMLEHIWEPFFTTKDAGKGTGLGLATVRGIVVSHHGFVELHTEVGRGSTFRVFLPAVVSESPRPSSATPFDIPDGHGELILVVDDDVPIRDLVSGILGQHGYRVVSCGDGVEAITLFNAHPGGIALVVTDVDMPRLGGVALARALLQLRPDLRLLAMSGLSRRETDGADVPEIQKLAHAFLRKPFTIENLLGTVHRLLQPPGKT
jgi:PAS domain S-box-containing protein